MTGALLYAVFKKQPREPVRGTEIQGNKLKATFLVI